MDKLLIRKDVYAELLEKGFGKKDYSKLTKKVITDKNGHKRTVFVKNDVTQTTQKQPKVPEIADNKKARYEEMLEKVKAGPDENALFVRDKGMLNKKDAIAHLEGKLNSSRSQQKEKESYEYNRDIRDFYDRTGLKGGMYEALARNEATKEERKDDKLKAGNRDDSMFKENDSIEFSRYGKILNGEIQSVRKDYKGNVSLLVHAEDNKDYWIEASDVTKHDSKSKADKKEKEPKKEIKAEEYKENYLDAKNEAGKDISEENTINTLSKTIEFTPEETNAIQSAADSIGYKPGKEGALINELSKINKDIYHNLLEKNQKTWDKSGKSPKTFSGFDLIQEKIKSMNIKANPVSNKFANMSGKDIVSNHISDLPMGRSVNTKSDLLNNIKSELNYLDYLKQNGSAAFNENKYNLLTAAKNNIDEVSKELKLEDK